MRLKFDEFSPPVYFTISHQIFTRDTICFMISSRPIRFGLNPVFGSVITTAELASIGVTGVNILDDYQAWRF